jgi:hypothetical protein
MLKKSCYIFAFGLSFIKMDPVFSTEENISSCIDESWEEKHSKLPKEDTERPPTPPKLKMKRTFKKRSPCCFCFKNKYRY